MSTPTRIVSIRFSREVCDHGGDCDTNAPCVYSRETITTKVPLPAEFARLFYTDKHGFIQSDGLAAINWISLVPRAVPEKANGKCWVNGESAHHRMTPHTTRDTVMSVKILRVKPRKTSTDTAAPTEHAPHPVHASLTHPR